MDMDMEMEKAKSIIPASDTALVINISSIPSTISIQFPPLPLPLPNPYKS